MKITNFLKNFNNKKKFCIFSVLFVLTQIFTIAFSAVFGSMTTISKTKSISNQFYEATTNNDDLLGLIMPFETSKNTFEIISNHTEKSKKARSMNNNLVIWDLYYSKSDNEYPASYSFNNNLTKKYSILLQPKSHYTNSFFDDEYKFDLLCGGTKNTSNSQDIYINKEIADDLLKVKNFTNYSSLIGTQICLPYKNYYNQTQVNYFYTIGGVIDSDSKSYRNYANYFGDFVVGNQYLSLPINVFSIFQLQKSKTGIQKQIELLSNIYKYDTAGRDFNALNFQLSYEYRFYPMSKFIGNNNINSCINNENNIVIKINSLYDFYFNKRNFIGIIISMIGIVGCLLLSIMINILFIKNTTQLKNKKVILSYVFSLTVISFIIALFVNKPLVLLIGIPNLANDSWLAFILSFAGLATLSISNLICYKKLL